MKNGGQRENPVDRKKQIEILGYPMGHMRNKVEELVARAMEEVLPGVESLCQCGMCTEDIYAIALNSLPARYQHSLTINIHRNVTHEEVCKEVREAAEKVKAKPKHT